MTLATSTLRPGLLVSLKTSVRGNVSYFKKPLDAEEIEQPSDATAPKVATARWETTRTIIDPVEHDLAKKARSKASSTIRAVCKLSAFGLLCPESDSEKLAKAVAEARRVVDEFNVAARLSHVTVYVITGRVAPDDVEALKAINSEIRDLMDEMENGIKELDVKAIRDAASKAKELGSMLTADYEAKVQIAVEAARAAANRIVKAGDDGVEIDQSAIRKIASMRTSFLDLDDHKEVNEPATQGRQLDLAGQE